MQQKISLKANVKRYKQLKVILINANTQKCVYEFKHNCFQELQEFSIVYLKKACYADYMWVDISSHETRKSDNMQHQFKASRGSCLCVCWWKWILCHHKTMLCQKKKKKCQQTSAIYDWTSKNCEADRKCLEQHSQTMFWSTLWEKRIPSLVWKTL